MLVDQVQKIAIDNHLWHNESRVLIAVSTGLDSMVLLHVLQELTNTGLTIGVAHVNHQLREVSIKEEAFIADYCHKEKIPFYTQRWQVPAKGNIESQAREFRYDFFKEIMEKYHYDVLVTAHHQEDQVETILMKMVRTGDLFASQGIVLTQVFGSGRLVRPLLYHSKETLRQYAQEHQLIFLKMKPIKH
ncbi:tRNA lysidine(34) synthetase TilS [Enterococcus alcedinis]|uniref:tRNA lysidine(34) synthetase TilS n=1 Tax=Enterococcus alcedinis TaxID=1274384 RepID=UPI00361F8230